MMMMVVIRSSSRCVNINAYHVILNIRRAKWKFKYLFGIIFLNQYK